MSEFLEETVKAAVRDEAGYEPVVQAGEGGWSVAGIASTAGILLSAR